MQALATALITGVFSLAGIVLQRAAPRELRRARQLSAELEAMDAGSPAARLVAAARDDLVAASVIRAMVMPRSAARTTASVLFVMAIAVAVLALIPVIYGLGATANGGSDDAATTYTVSLACCSAVLLVIGQISAAHYGSRVQRLRARVRDAWDLPDELRITRFADELPVPHPSDDRPIGRRRRSRHVTTSAGSGALRVGSARSVAIDCQRGATTIVRDGAAGTTAHRSARRDRYLAATARSSRASASTRSRSRSRWRARSGTAARSRPTG